MTIKLTIDYFRTKVAGRSADIVGIRCDERGIMALDFSEPSGEVFKYEPPNSTSFGDQPLLSESFICLCSML